MDFLSPSDPAAGKRHTSSSSDTTPKRVVVIAYDETTVSEVLLHKAIRTRLLEPTDTIHLVHIIPQDNLNNVFAPLAATASIISGITSMNGGQSGVSSDADHDTLMNVSRDKLLHVAKVLNTNGFSDVTVETLYGDPPRSLSDYCESVQPTFLMTGTRGHGRVHGTLLGSVSSELAKTCPFPVMIVKLTDEEIATREQKKAAAGDMNAEQATNKTV